MSNECENSSFKTNCRNGPRNGQEGASLLNCLMHTVLYSFFFILGLLVFSSCPLTDSTYDERKIWQTVTATILKSNVAIRKQKDRRPYWFQVVYEYELNGTTHRSDTYREDYRGDKEFSRAQERAEHFEPGRTAVAYVHTNQPRQAVLQQKESDPPTLLLASFVCFLISIVGFLYIWTHHFRGFSALLDRVHERIEQAFIRIKPYLAMIAMCSFVILGFYFLYIETIRPYMQIQRAQNWNPTRCQIEFSRVRVHLKRDSDSSRSYSADVVYRYNVEGKTHRSDRLSFEYGTRSDRAECQRIVEDYPEGKTVTCYYNPDKPSESVIHRSSIGNFWPGLLLPLFSILLGFGEMAIVILKLDR